MATATERRSYVIRSDYVTTEEEHAKDVKQDKEELMTAHFQAKLKIQKPTAQKVARKVIKGEQFSANSGKSHSPSGCSAGELAGKTAPLKAERILMLAFPVDNPQLSDNNRREFNLDQKARLLQNKSAVSILLDRQDSTEESLEELLQHEYETLELRYNTKFESVGVLFHESRSYSNLGCCSCKHCRGCAKLDMRLSQLTRNLDAFHARLNGDVPALMAGGEAEEIDEKRRLQKWHCNDSRITNTLHTFLHHKCSDSILAQIIFNGHGSEFGQLIFHDKHNVHLDKIIEDLSECYGSIHDARPPYKVNIVFAQCHGGCCKYAGEHSILASKGQKLIRVISLVNTGNTCTYDVGHDMHIELEDYALDQKKEREARQNEQRCEMGKAKKDQKAEAPTSKDGEDQEAEAPTSKDGEDQEAEASTSKDGEDQEAEAPTSKHGEDQEAEASTSKDGEGQEAEAPTSKDGEDQEAEASTSKHGEDVNKILRKGLKK